ncbi:MAG: formate dehydrogenase accessory sulfurtransferase FdhD [Gemmatimonadetes bacterium]|nr:formate dehydrogenase accessory sulfurtransferase FdhD [Gemmatimonadota bacterium]
MRKSSMCRRSVEEVAARDGVTRRRARSDVVATEEPLEIRIVRAEELRTGRPQTDAGHRISVTMRTPGADFELAAGFLFGEGLLEHPEDILAIRYCVATERDRMQQYNIVNVFLAPGVAFDAALLQRNFYTTSSCGVCGKASIEAVRGPSRARIRGTATVEVATILSLPAKLREAQQLFERTGGLHAAALFSSEGELLRLREDVGRHNAMDKLVGGSLLAGEAPLSDRIALMSGRLSFELVQKAARAGVPVLAGVSAPSSLAVELAEESGMTLIGFLRENRFNVYAGGERVV